jgi:subtilisin family serine protease
MGKLTRAAALWLAFLGGAAVAAPAAAASPASAPRVVVAFANQPHSPPGPAGTTGNRYGGDGYRVGQSAQQQAHRVAADYALRQVASWPIKVLAMHCVVYEIGDGRAVAAVLDALSHDRRVALAQPLQQFHTVTDAAGAPYNDPLYELQTNLLPLGIPRAHERAQGAGVRIALIDTGVDATHPDIKGRIRATHSYLGTPAPAASFLRHGTGMAGLMAAVANNHIGIVGIAPQAQLEVFAACWQLAAGDDAAACNTFTLAQALAGALASGAPLVNLSIAGPADPLLTALVQTGLKRGVIFVGAAGADGEGFPTAIPGVIAAAASERAPPPGALPAPAQHVLTLRPGAEYDFESGASVAAAEVTAAIALLLSASPRQFAAATIVSLLNPVAAPGGTAAIDVAAALVRLDSEQQRDAVTARARH